MRSFLGICLTLLASVSSAQNLLANGDFSQGNVGFTSDYTYNAPADGALNDDSVYTLTRNTTSPYALNTYGITSYSEHTTGTGLFMAVNGSVNPGTLVWQETLTGLTVGQSYSFGAWVSRWTVTDDPAAQVSVFAGGVQIASFSDPGAGHAGVWVQHTSQFTASSSSLTFQIRDYNSSYGGNDFGLDDLSVTANPVPEPTTLAALSMGVLMIQRRKQSARR